MLQRAPQYLHHRHNCNDEDALFAGIALEADGSDGTTTETSNYSFLHEQPAGGINYYRLKQLDTDGAFEYSNVISVIMNAGNELSIFPNPTGGRLTIAGAEMDDASLEITDNLGQVIRRTKLSTQNIDISDLPNGIYIFTIKTEDQTILKKIFKE